MEMADADRRGWIGGSGALSVSAGITLTYVMGALAPWRWVCVAGATLAAAVVILMPTMPETPSWLVAQGHTDRQGFIILGHIEKSF